MNNIKYDDYDKISDDMYYLGNNTNLRFNVILSKKNQKNNDRYFFHSECRYPSKYKNNETLVSIRRSYNYYLSIDTRDFDTSIMIRVQDILLFRNAINNASKWGSDGTFGINNKKELVIAKKRRTIKVDSLPQHKFIWFDPVVIYYNEIYYPGIRMTLCNESTYVDIMMDNFFGLVYIINQLDMFGYAQNMLNYLERPSYGYNIYDIFDEEPNDNPTEPENGVVKAQRRTIPGIKKNVSKFDDIMD